MPYTQTPRNNGNMVILLVAMCFFAAMDYTDADVSFINILRKLHSFFSSSDITFGTEINVEFSNITFCHICI